MVVPIYGSQWPVAIDFGGICHFLYGKHEIHLGPQSVPVAGLWSVF